MNEILPSSVVSEQVDKVAEVVQFEQRTDENAIDPTMLSHKDIVGACISQSVFAVSQRSTLEVARIVNGMLSLQRKADDTNKTHQAWYQETRARITLAEQCVDEDALYEDDVTSAIVNKLHETVSQAKEYEEERVALRNLIDLRSVLLIEPEAITEHDDKKWTALIDKLGPRK